jgi:hypothetical protein
MEFSKSLSRTGSQVKAHIREELKCVWRKAVDDEEV